MKPIVDSPYSFQSDVANVLAGIKTETWLDDEFFVIPFLGVALLAVLFFMSYRIRKNKESFPDYISRNLIGIALIVWLCGMVLYFIGYNESGTGKNVLTLVIRSVLSSFEMFLSKSNLIGVSDVCKRSPLYMFCFAFTHASALAVTMIFVISCFGKRLRDWIVLGWWKWSNRIFGKKRQLYVFWGVNEKSILLANNIQQSAIDDCPRIVFVDFPAENQENKSGQSFSGILGLLNYKVTVVKQLAGVNYVMMKTDISLSGQEIASAAKTDANVDLNILDSLHLYKLNRLIKHHDNVTFFILGDDQDVNLRSSLRLLDCDIADRISKIYCCERRSRTSLIHEEVENRLKIVDDSHEAVMELTLQHKELSQPINFVDIDSEHGFVTSKFTALIVGFGYTGQDAMKFLYEFSAFPDKNGDKSPVKLYVCDKNLDSMKGDIYNEIPQMTELEKSGDIELCPYNFGTVAFADKLKEIINDLNYVVVATGNDALNMQIAVKLYEYAMQYKYRDGKFNKFKIFVRLYDSSSKYVMEKTIARYDYCFAKALVLFGDPKDIYTKSWLIDDAEAIAAENYYAAYCMAESEFVCNDTTESSKPKIKDSYQELNLLKARNRLRSDSQNRANVRHCYTKAMLLGLNEMSHEPELPKWGFSIEDTDVAVTQNWYKKLINASICEHLRWNAAHYMLGYTTWPEKEANEYSDSCDWLTKQHRYLVPWQQLNDKTKNYDYVVVVTTINLTIK